MESTEGAEAARSSAVRAAKAEAVAVKSGWASGQAAGQQHNSPGLCLSTGTGGGKG